MGIRVLGGTIRSRERWRGGVKGGRWAGKKAVGKMGTKEGLRSDGLGIGGKKRRRGKGGRGKTKNRLGNEPRLFSMSTTSSRATWPSLSRSSISNASRISRTWTVGSLERGSLLKGVWRSVVLAVMNEVVLEVDAAPLRTGVRVGEGAGSRRGVREVRGVLQLDVLERGEALVFASLVGEERGVYGFVGELKDLVGEVVGVVGRSTVEGDAGDSGRRNGEVRGDPNERGEGL